MERSGFSQRAVLLAAAAAAVLLLLKFFFPVMLPFLLGLLLAKLSEPAVDRLQRRCGWPRWMAAGLCISILYCLVALALWGLSRQAVVVMSNLFHQLPVLTESLSGPSAQLNDRLAALAAQLPDGLGAALSNWAEHLSEQDLAEQLYDKVFAFATKILSALPTTALFLFTTILASFMISAQLPRLKTRLRHLLPRNWLQRGVEVRARMKRAFSGWCIAQLKLMSITFCIVAAGQLVLGLPHPLFRGLLIALLDALPVFGTGTVLLPWAAFQFLVSNTRCGIGLLITYGVAVLTRESLEPKLIGRHIGLNPLFTLVALYTGYHFLGLVGMILFPIFAILLKQLWSVGRSPGLQSDGSRGKM